MSTYHCVGCGNPIAWDGTGMFAMTCGCRATFFASDDGEKMAPPASFIISILEQRTDIPHIDYYMGISDHVSTEKTKIIDILKRSGSIWSWQCKVCQFKFVERIKWEVKNQMTFINLHPDIVKLIED